MTDEELETAVMETFERQGRSAPAQNGLLETVRAGSRRRRQRDRTVGVALAAVAVIGVLGGTSVLPVVDRGDPNGNGPDAAEILAGPGIFAADEINLCLVRNEGRLTDLILTARNDEGAMEDINTTVQQSDDGTPHLTYVHDADTYTMRLEVRSGTSGPQPPGNVRRVDIDSRDGQDGRDGWIGWIGDVPDKQGRTLYIDTGIAETVLQLTIDGMNPTDDQLLGWAQKITPTTNPEACE